ncbi:hypothetical protein ACVNSK_10790 [Corynebacterium propinquum]|uniref:hypothetical protein n=1 Tax=Corynebacterium propinquum TaxID=43769 RepID=UPI00205704AD|nr:hypothetical protein [Corynebacterium propinquum]MDK4235758.1 hypothetical protein [Corynebacterium propinquum]MDK4252770.1 hypothetical protein [Corynebacterium propinquum]DAY26848.1 MAG TPA: hypothetical protein [Caudoviricetes sp.]
MNLNREPHKEWAVALDAENLDTKTRTTEYFWDDYYKGNTVDAPEYADWSTKSCAENVARDIIKYGLSTNSIKIHHIYLVSREVRLTGEFEEVPGTPMTHA